MMTMMMVVVVMVEARVTMKRERERKDDQEEGEVSLGCCTKFKVAIMGEDRKVFQLKKNNNK